MANPYTAPSISGYNTNPPPDDGTNSAANEVKWSTQKTKLTDPIKTLAETDITETTAAFLKVLGGGGVTSTAISYTVVAADQGNLVRATAASITITTPDATDVTAPFVFALLNNSSGTITFDGSGSQSIDGNANVTVPAGAGMVVFTDGTNWFTTGQQGTLAGKQLMYGDIINGTIVESNATNAVTFALKTLAGTDPSTTDQVLVCFRSATATTGNYVYRAVTAALSLTISAGSTLGALNATPFDVCLVLFDDAGTIRIGVLNPVKLSDNSIYPLAQIPPIASSTAEGGAGAADSAKVFYTGTAVTSKPYLPIAVARYSSGLSTAGSWNVDPVLQLYSHGVPLPNQVIPQLYHAREEQTSGTNGGTATSGSWFTRVLNTEKTNEISGASLASNQITLPAGTYEIEASAPCTVVDRHKAKLYNVTDSSDVIIGTSQHGSKGSGDSLYTTASLVRGRFSLAGTKVLELRQQVQTTRNTDGLGVASSFSVVEVYSEVLIKKVA